MALNTTLFINDFVKRARLLATYCKRFITSKAAVPLTIITRNTGGP